MTSPGVRIPADPTMTQLTGLLNEELLRLEAVMLGLRSDTTHFYLRFRAALAALWVKVHIQNTLLGGSSYNPSTYVSSTLVDCRSSRIQDVTINRGGPLWVFLVPVQYDGAGVAVLYDGQSGRPDRMTFIALDDTASGSASAAASSLVESGEGPEGPAGPPGPTGPTGTAGPQGVLGWSGEDGDEGPQGPPGVSGAQGPQGPTGATGLMGMPGGDGDDGEQGIPGPSGPQGPQGAQGAAGAQTLPWWLFAPQFSEAVPLYADMFALTSLQ